MSKSYFEIGGEIFECNITSIPSSNYSPSSFRGAPTTMSEGATPRNKQGAGGRKGDHTTTTAYTPYSGIGSPVVWAGSQILMRAAQMVLPKDVHFVDGRWESKYY